VAIARWFLVTLKKFQLTGIKINKNDNPKNNVIKVKQKTTLNGTNGIIY